MLIRERMTTRLITATPDESLYEAARRMLDNRVNGLPVVTKEDGVLAGLIELEDLLPDLEMVPFSTVRALRLFSKWVDGHNLAELRPAFEQMKVRDIMRLNPPRLPDDATVETAMTLLQKKNLRHLLIVDQKKALVGVVTRSDFLRILLGKD